MYLWLQSEVKFLGKFSHPNLVKLLGYCWEDKEYLLVYEYMQKGSLENHLFRSKKHIYIYIYIYIYIDISTPTYNINKGNGVFFA